MDKFDKIKKLRSEGFQAELLMHSKTGDQVVTLWKVNPLVTERVDISVEELAPIIFGKEINITREIISKLREEILLKGSPTSKSIKDIMTLVVYK
jgi:hypothetical protein